MWNLLLAKIFVCRLFWVIFKCKSTWACLIDHLCRVLLGFWTETETTFTLWCPDCMLNTDISVILYKQFVTGLWPIMLARLYGSLHFYGNASISDSAGSLWSDSVKHLLVECVLFFFKIGCGAIGCEMMKLYALLGVCTQQGKVGVFLYSWVSQSQQI